MICFFCKKHLWAAFIKIDENRNCCVEHILDTKRDMIHAIKSITVFYLHDRNSLENLYASLNLVPSNPTFLFKNAFYTSSKDLEEEEDDDDDEENFYFTEEDILELYSSRTWMELWLPMFRIYLIYSKFLILY